MKRFFSRCFEIWFPISLVAVMLAGFPGCFERWGNPNTANLSEALKAAFTSRSSSQTETPQRPEVLVVSAKPSDRFSVATTVEPRGYTVTCAGNTEAGLLKLRSDRERIGIVVIDAALPNAGQMLSAARTVCPSAYPVLLRGPRQTAQVAGLLYEAVNWNPPATPAPKTIVSAPRKHPKTPISPALRLEISAAIQTYQVLQRRVWSQYYALLSLVFMMAYLVVFDRVRYRKALRHWQPRLSGVAI